MIRQPSGSRLFPNTAVGGFIIREEGELTIREKGELIIIEEGEVLAILYLYVSEIKGKEKVWKLR